MKFNYKTHLISNLFAIVAAALTAYTFTQLNSLVSFASVVALLNLLRHRSKKQIFANGVVFGFVFGLCIYCWMLEGITRYSGSTVWYGAFFVFFSALMLGVYYGFILFACKTVFIENPSSRLIFYFNRLGLAAFWTICEVVLSGFLEGLPMHNSRLGFALSSNLFFAQWSSIGGVACLTFIFILTNFILIEYLHHKKSEFLFSGIAIIVFAYAAGAFLYYNFEPNLVNSKIKVALASTNLNPDVQWSPENGNALAADIITLNNKAIQQNPNFIVWPESIVPWIFSKNDDLVNEIIKPSKSQKITQVLGLSAVSESDSKKLFNSAFYFNSDGSTSIYQKQIPLKGLEVPFFKILIPFIYNQGFSFQKGTSAAPIQTKFGKVGTLICNESTEEQATLEQAKKGVNFFFNLSNDSWFSNTCIAEHHLYYARLMAISVRKDFAISNNCGYSAIIESSGTIVQSTKAKEPTLLLGTISPNDNMSFFSQYSNLFFIFLIFLAGANLLYIIFKKSKKPFLSILAQLFVL